jgi:hypothetical protein
LSDAGGATLRHLFDADADAEGVESTDRRYLYPRERERCSMPGAP